MSNDADHRQKQEQRQSQGASNLLGGKKLSSDAKITLSVHGLYMLGSSMAGIFLNLYLWRLTEDLFINGMYQIIAYVVSPFLLAYVGKIAKVRDRLFVYRIGIAATSLFYLLVVLAQEMVVDYAYVFAVLNGVVNAFYWLGYLALMYDVSTDENRVKFLGFNLMMVNTASLIGPSFAGFMISRSEGLSGYVIIFTIAFILFMVATVGSFKLKSFVSHHKTYYLKFTNLLLRKNKPWRKTLIGWFIFGLLNGTMLFIPNILLYHVFQHESTVGYIGAIFTGIIVITGYMLARYAKEHQVRAYMGFGALGYVLAASLLLIDITAFTVITFLVIYSICFPTQLNAYSAYYYRVVGRLPLKGSLRIETIVLREISLNMGRILSILGLIMFTTELTSLWLPIVIVAASALQFLFLWVIDREALK